jgi:hypothetical protein
MIAKESKMSDRDPIWDALKEHSRAKFDAILALIQEAPK